MQILTRVVVILAAIAFLFSLPAVASEVTKNSTQPEDIVDKLEPPALCATCHAQIYEDWAGSMMGNDFYDPAFLATLSIAEQDVPGVGDYCLRCHVAGWFEGKSEPPKGDTLGRSLVAPPAIDRESVPLCDLCHRLERVGMRESRADGSMVAEGNGSVYFSARDPWKGGKHPLRPIHQTAELCGSCHDVANPLVDSVNDSTMKQPLERTYTEWRYSFFGETNYTCQECHPPMKFPGAQTWLLYPGMSSLYGDIDAGWRQAGYPVSASREQALRRARARNEHLMRQAADVQILEAPPKRSGQELEIPVKVTNQSGHRLPTGFAEGRQLWLHIKVTDAQSQVVFEDGRLDEDGSLVKTEQTKVYEQKAAVEGEKSFHFARLDEITKDNRIPPRGFDKAAYEKEGAFIVAADYDDGQNWDVATYRFTVPPGTRGPLKVVARLNYETFSKEYIEWLRETDKTLAANFGGPAAATPDDSKTWGEVTYKLWQAYGKGKPTLVAGAVSTVPLGGGLAVWSMLIIVVIIVLLVVGTVGPWRKKRVPGKRVKR